MKTDDSKGGTLFLLRDILIHEMGLDESRVVLWNSDILIPPDKKLFVAFTYLAGKPYHSKTEEGVDENGDFVETQEINVQEMIDVNIMSRGPEAMFRKEEVIMALASTYSQQVQERNGFRIAPLPNAFRDNSELEASARLTRFTFTLVVLGWYKKTKKIEYFDTFKLQAKDETHDTGVIDQPKPEPEGD